MDGKLHLLAHGDPQFLSKQILLDYGKISACKTDQVSAVRIQITSWLLNSHFVTEPDVMGELFWIHIWMLAVSLNSGLKLRKQVQMLFNVRKSSFPIGLVKIKRHKLLYLTYFWIHDQSMSNYIKKYMK